MTAPTGGAPAPDFTLPDHHGAPVSLSGTDPSAPTLLVFYPFAFSSICGGELREIQEALPTLAANVLAISCDHMFALRAYADHEGYGFPLLSDFWPHGEVARAYGVFDEDKGCALRGSFLIQDGAVRWSVVNSLSQARPLADYHEALARIR
jgi:mycoredoxin-dependent peroxiredoxin